MRHTGTLRRLKALAAASAVGLCVVCAAGAKLWPSLSLALTNDSPKAHRLVTATVTSDVGLGRSCHMKLLAVAPGVSRFHALDAFLAGGVGIWEPTGYVVRKITPTPRMGFLRSLTRVGPKAWRARIRFPREGVWRLIVPNDCADGYRYPPPVDRAVNVR